MFIIAIIGAFLFGGYYLSKLLPAIFLGFFILATLALVLDGVREVCIFFGAHWGTILMYTGITITVIVAAIALLFKKQIKEAFCPPTYDEPPPIFADVEPQVEFIAEPELLADEPLYYDGFGMQIDPANIMTPEQLEFDNMQMYANRSRFIAINPEWKSAFAEYENSGILTPAWPYTIECLEIIEDWYRENPESTIVPTEEALHYDHAQQQFFFSPPGH